MIIKSAVRGNGGKLAAYLLTDKKNDRAELVEMRGWTAATLSHALILSEKIALGQTHCEKPFYHVSFRLPSGEELTPEQWQQCADRLEQRLGLDEHHRALVLHTYKGEKHLHVVWDRIDENTLKAANLFQEHRKCMEVARALEKELGLQQVSNEKREPEKELVSPTREEEQQARRKGQDLKEIREAIRAAWEKSADGQSFAEALDERGFILAQGDQRDYVAMDEQSSVYTIGKRTTGATAKEVRAKLADLDREHIPTVEQAREQLPVRIAKREQRKAELRDYEAAQAERAAWEERIVQAVVQKAEEEQKRDAVLLAQYKQRAELLAKQEQQKAALEKQQAERRAQREKRAKELEERAKQQIEAELATKQLFDKHRLERKLKENHVGLWGRTAERLKQFIGHKLDEHQAEQRKDTLHKTIVENDGRNQDRDQARAARQDKAHERGQATLEIRPAEAREKRGIHAPERDEALKAAQRTATQTAFSQTAAQTTPPRENGWPDPKEAAPAEREQPAAPERDESGLEKTRGAVGKGRETIGNAAKEANKGIHVLDKATGVTSGLSNGVASILDGIAKPIEGLILGLDSLLFGGASPAPPIHRRERGPTPDQIRAAEIALTNINQSLKRGDDINAADLRNLPKSQLERIREGGDEYLMKMCQNWEIQQRERERENERER